MALQPAMIKRAPTSTHASRQAYNLKHGAGAWAQKIGKAPNLGGMNGAPDPRPMAPGTAAPVITPATPAPAAAAPAPAAPASTPEENSNALYPGIRAFEPENYQGSPLYQFQLDQGTKQLNKLYAARGYTGSGKEIEGNARFANELGAQEAQRAQGVAEQEANRLERMQQNESTRLTGQGNDKWSRIMDVLNLMVAQNPMNAATEMTGKEGELVSGQGTVEGKNVVNQTPKVGGGGGGTPPPRYNPPTPSGPNMGGINSTGAIVNAQNGMDYGSILTELLGSLF